LASTSVAWYESHAWTSQLYMHIQEVENQIDLLCEHNNRPDMDFCFDFSAIILARRPAAEISSNRCYLLYKD
jgi:hypothetical protein